MEEVINSGVDESKPVLLALLYIDPLVSSTSVLVDMSAVDKNVLRWRWATSEMDGTIVQHPNWVGIPIRKDQWPEIDIVIGCSRSFNNDGTDHSLTVLGRVMAVVPRGSILCGPELINLLLCRSDRAFGNSVDTVHEARVVLTNSVPVDGCSVILHFILYSDFEGVSPFYRTLEPGNIKNS